MARPTVDRYLDLLKSRRTSSSGLPAYSTNPRKEVTRSQKVFFWDTGIRNALLTRSQPRNCVLTSAPSGRTGSSPKWPSTTCYAATIELFFWRTRAQSEVDFVVKAESGLRAFEVKWNPRGAGRPRSTMPMACRSSPSRT